MSTLLALVCLLALAVAAPVDEGGVVAEGIVEGEAVAEYEDYGSKGEGDAETVEYEEVVLVVKDEGEGDAETVEYEEEVLVVKDEDTDEGEVDGAEAKEIVDEEEMAPKEEVEETGDEAEDTEEGEVDGAEAEEIVDEEEMAPKEEVEETGDEAEGYNASREYVYRYSLLAWSGLGTGREHMAGTRLDMLLHLRLQERYTATARFTNVSVSTANGLVGSEEYPDSKPWTPVAGDEVEAVRDQLVKPFMFRLVGGHASQLRVHQGESLYSVNIKRGLLATLQLNLDERDVIEESDDNLATEGTSTVVDSPFPAFRSYEWDLVGDCASLYHIQEGGGHMSVSKVRNYNNCRTKTSHVRTGLYAAMHDTQDDNTKTPVRMTSESHYDVTGSRHNYVINTLNVNTRITFAPLGQDAGNAATTDIRQQLELASSQPAAALELSELGEVETHTMVLSHDRSVVLPQMLDPVAMEQDVADLLEELTSEGIVHPTVDATAPRVLYKLSEILSAMPHANLVNVIHRELIDVDVSRNEKFWSRHLLLDLLPSLHRADLMPLIEDLLTLNQQMNGELFHPVQAAVIVHTAAFLARPSHMMFHDMMRIVHEKVVSSQPLLRRHMVLALGVLANRIKTLYEEDSARSLQMEQELHKIEVELAYLLTHAATLDEQLAAVAAIENAAIPGLFDALATLAKDGRQPGVLRTRAVYAMFEMARDRPDDVTQLLLPFFLDQTMPRGLRVASYSVVMYAKPSHDTIQSIMHALKHELSLEVVTFVYTHLESLVSQHSCHECQPDILEEIQAALDHLPRLHPGLLNSRSLVLSQFIKSLGPLGIDVLIQFFNMDYSNLPHSFYAEFMASLFGSTFNIAAIDMNVQGLQSIFFNLFGPFNKMADVKGGNADIPSIFHSFYELASGIKGNEAIKNILESQPAHTSDSYLGIALRILGFELTALHLGLPDIEHAFNHELPKLPLLLSLLETGHTLRHVGAFNMHDIGLVMATPAGLPFYIELDATMIYTLHGDVTLTGLQDLASLLHQPTFTASSKLHQSSSGFAEFSQFTEVAYFRAGAVMQVKFQQQLPLEVSLSAEGGTGGSTVRLDWVVPVAEPPLLHVHANPQSVVKTRLRATNDDNRRGYHINVENIGLAPHSTVTWGPVWAVSDTGLPLVVRLENPKVFDLMKPETWGLNSIILDVFLTEDEAEHRSDKLQLEVSVSQGSEWTCPAPGDLACDDVDTEHGEELEQQFEVKVFLRNIGGRAERETLIRWLQFAHPVKYQWGYDVQLLSAPSEAREHHYSYKYVLNGRVFLPDFFHHEGPESGNDYEYYDYDVQAKLKYGPVTDDAPHVAKLTLAPVELELPEPHVRPDWLAAYDDDAEHRDGAIQGLLNATFLHPTLLPHSDFVSWMPAAIELTLTFEDEETGPLLEENIIDAARLFHFIDDENPGETATNPLNTVKLLATVDGMHETTQVVMTLPSVDLTWDGLPLVLPHMFQVYPPTLAPLRHIQYLLHGNIPTGMCTLSLGEQTPHLVTYDLMNMQLPASNCEVLLSKDCSPLATFAVTVRVCADGDTHVRLLLPHLSLEAVHSGNNTFTLEDDTGAAIELGALGVAVHRQFYIHGDIEYMVHILHTFNEGLQLYVGTFDLLVSLYYDEVNIKAPELLRGQLCGLCGDYNGDLHAEMTCPNGDHVHTSVEAFFRSCIDDSAGCGADAYSCEAGAEYCGQLHTCALRSTTAVIERRGPDDTPHVCFSLEIVMQCSRACAPSDVTPVSRDFHCLPAYDAPTRHLLHEVEHGPVALMDDTVHFTGFVAQANACVVRH